MLSTGFFALLSLNFTLADKTATAKCNSCKVLCDDLYSRLNKDSRHKIIEVKERSGGWFY